jgi:hypothetical protein
MVESSDGFEGQDTQHLCLPTQTPEGIRVEKHEECLSYLMGASEHTSCKLQGSRIVIVQVLLACNKTFPCGRVHAAHTRSVNPIVASHCCIYRLLIML